MRRRVEGQLPRLVAGIDRDDHVGGHQEFVGELGVGEVHGRLGAARQRSHEYGPAAGGSIPPPPVAGGTVGQASAARSLASPDFTALRLVSIRTAGSIFA
jgi:hypothetical protein